MPTPSYASLKRYTEGGADESVQSRSRKLPGQGDFGDGFVIGDMFGVTGLTGESWSLQLNVLQAADEIPPWSYYPARRDRALRRFWKTEPIVAGTVYSVQSRIRALNFNVDGGTRLRQHYYNLIQDSDLGGGPSNLFGKTVIDLLTQDNGAFWEKIGAGRPDGALVGPVQGIAHLDSGLCYRTFDPEFPVIYYDPQRGNYHRLHHSRVVRMSLMAQPNELARDIGYCAVSRALRAVQIMRAIQIHKYEKITGTLPGIGYGNGFNRRQFDDAIKQTMAEDEAEGLTMWHRVPFLLNPDPNAKVDLEILSLAGLPDGYDAEKDTTLYVYAIALAFGIDAREIWPATSVGATKADATIQHLKAQGKGIGDVIQTIERAINWEVFPGDESVTMQFDYTDDEQDKVESQLHLLQEEMLTSLQTAGAISPAEHRKIALMMGMIKPGMISEQLPPDAIPANQQQLGMNPGQQLGQQNPAHARPHVASPTTSPVRPGPTQSGPPETQMPGSTYES